MIGSSRRQASDAELFRSLHVRGDPFVMPNAWDGASAALFRDAGAEAIGSSSAAIANSLGRRDGMAAVSRFEALAHAALLARVSGLPVNGDLEDAFGPLPDDCASTVATAIEYGLAGVGIEDTTADASSPIHGFDHAVSRIRAAAAAADGRIVLTGRTDLLLHGSADVDEVIRRLCAFAEVGADALFAPGLGDIGSVQRVADAVAPVPLNVLVFGPLVSATLAELAAAGVARVSLGGGPYRVALAAAREVVATSLRGEFTLLRSALSTDIVETALSRTAGGAEAAP